MGRPSSSRCQDYEKENNVDPDDGNSWSCHACTLPIFSTPFKSTIIHGGRKLFLHDQCANLPSELMDHILHRGPLILKEISPSSSYSCNNCKRKWGSMIYRCRDRFLSSCGFALDVLCALQIKVLHRSHEHRLMAIKWPTSFICRACGTQHDQGCLGSALSYLCNDCGFWIHSDCASLPNAIMLHASHQHSLFLTYNRAGSNQAYTCAICGGNAQGIGVYFCGKCGYYAHINCAIMSDAQSFKPVLIRDAKLAGLLHFPIPDEFTSVMRYIMESTTSSSHEKVDARDEHQCQSEGKLFQEGIHQHTLIFQDQDGGGHQGQSSHVCNACVQPVSPPFYSCSECPNFYLHDCCANLPSKIEHPVHKHTLFLFPRAPKSSISGLFWCEGCRCQSNRFAYSCKICDFSMDVVCALLPPSITHESHGKTHILNMSREYKHFDYCNSCNYILGGIFYECRICRHFKLDAECVLFPNTIKHKFDEHFLKLTTKLVKSVTTDDDDDRIVSSKKIQQICEICEDDIELRKWYYSCGQCNQSFHYDCIPFVNVLSRIKFGVTIHVNCHDCPLTCIPESSIYGYQCGYCREAFIPRSVRRQKPTYECSKCNFKIHENVPKNV